MSDEIITSTSNQSVKKLSALRKSGGADGVVFLEGLRLVKDAFESGVTIKTLVLTPDNRDFAASIGFDGEVLLLADKAFAAAAGTVNPQGIAAVVQIPESFGKLPSAVQSNAVYAVLENVQDPGNVGTIIRTCDAFDLSGVILAGDSCSPFNEKVLRSTMGSMWHIPVTVCKNIDDVFDFCDANNIDTLAMELNGDELDKCKGQYPCAYFIGNEGNGLTASTISRCRRRIKIPMPGKAESLNAAVASAVIGYELAVKGR